MDQVTIHELKQSLEKEHDLLVAELKEIARPDPKIKGNWNAKYPKFDQEEYGSHGSLETEADEVEEYEELLEAEHNFESPLFSIFWVGVWRDQGEPYSSRSNLGYLASQFPGSLGSGRAISFSSATSKSCSFSSDFFSSWMVTWSNIKLGYEFYFKMSTFY